MNNYPIGDFLIQIKNAGLANRKSVNTEYSKLKMAVAEVLKKEKIVSDISQHDNQLSITLAYHKKEPMILDLKLISRPGLRQYMSVDELKSRKRRRSTFLVVSTPKGVMSSRDAEKANTGGEVIAEIW